MKKILTFVLSGNKFSRVVVIICILVVLGNILGMKKWQKQNSVIEWDIISYYAYLPATFIYGDVSLFSPNEKYNKYQHIFWPRPTPNGKSAFVTSMGMSILYSPFFLMGHLTAYITGAEPGGFSWPYKFFLLLSSVFYLTIGLIFLRRLLLKYYKDWIAAFTILLVVFGTNLLHYATVDAVMSHVYNFTLIILFVFQTIKWYASPTVKNSLLVGFLFGLIALVRPSNFVIIIFFILYNVISFKSFIQRLRYFILKAHHVLIMVVCFLIVWLPQMLYWHKVSGQWLYYSYQGEAYLFRDPVIIKGLFGYRNGWLLYTPVMLFAILGIPFMMKKQKEFIYPIFVYLILSIYAILSWSCWWYTGFGNRAFIDLYGVLAFPLAAFITFIVRQKWVIKITGITILFFLLAFNIFQNKQYRNGAIHYNSMTKKAYWINFGKLYPQNGYWEALQEPDAIKEKRKFVDDN